jgi:Leucine-rich repeat (LRR) protein
MVSVDLKGRPIISSLVDVLWFEWFGVNIEEIIKLKCNNHNLGNLIGCPPNLKKIECDNNYITTLCHVPRSVIQLSAYHNNITSLLGCPPNLEYLNCGHNPIVNLDHAPHSLRDLEIMDCYNITELPHYPPNLTYLAMWHVNVQSLFGIPPTVTHLYVMGTYLTSLKYIPRNLIELDISYTDVPNYKDVPSTVKIFNRMRTGNNDTIYGKYPDPEWHNLSIEQIHMKNLKSKITQLNKPLLSHQNKLLYRTWVSYFDTPNDENIAKQSLLLFNSVNFVGVSHPQNLHNLSG